MTKETHELRSYKVKEARVFLEVKKKKTKHARDYDKFCAATELVLLRVFPTYIVITGKASRAERIS